METFIVFIVSICIFTAQYEGENFRESDGYVLEPRLQERYHG